MARQGLIAAGWTYRLGRACREFGSCDEVKKRLNFSAPIASLNTEDDLREVVLHEVAHAKAGNDKGHGRGWKLMALAVGANPQRTCGAHIKTPDNKYHATCAGCGHVHKMTRPPKNVMCCDPCVRRHVHPYMSLTRKVDVHDRFKLIWIEQATGRSGERKSDFAAVREVPPPAPQPGEQRTAEREAWTVKPITSAVQSSLF
jgi:predicted SprT family Zn-dependent metalloprotease